MIVIVTVFLALLACLPLLAKKYRRSSRVGCVSNLQQIGTAFLMFGNDNDGKFPAEVPTNMAWNYFQTVGDQLSSPSVLLCPWDVRSTVGRIPISFGIETDTNSFAHPSHRNASLSYFYGVDATRTDPNTILAGDRNISSGGKMLTGLVKLDTNRLWSYTTEMHNDCGNVCFADGSVQQVTSAKLQTNVLSNILAYTNATQRIILP